MKLAIAFLLITTLPGCAVYSGASLASYIATDKTLTDHATTAVVPYGNCSTNQLFQGKFYCEIQDPSVTYNRNAY